MNCLSLQTIKFEIWDTAGQERFHSLAPMYYRNAQAAAIVYDVSNVDSLAKAKNWIAELQRQSTTHSMVVSLVGNKCDLTTTRSLSYSVIIHLMEGRRRDCKRKWAFVL